LADLLERPRLAGARPFVAQLVSALTLPLRRLRPPELPVGGYADVATHGRPDQLLPSQLALDEWDFLRRYADHELLYFRREEPHARTEHELVVLLDQGMRTWGDVRLVLAAAVLALGRQAVGKRLPFFVAATSGGGEIADPLQIDPEVLGALLEASDLTAHPGLALERVLQQPGRVARDVVLLTHPRALREEDVRAAARRVTSGTRLFALALDGSGRASLEELKHGVPVPVTQFRVNFAAVPPPAAPRPPVVWSGPGLWHGDVEPVAFPFQFGASGPLRPDLIDFDQSGGWLLTVGYRGRMLHLWKTDGSRTEILPRPMLEDRLLGDVRAVLGVAGGFVVGGAIGDRLVAAHYDLDRRTCKAQVLTGWGQGGSWTWTYSLEHHTVVVSRGEVGWALDLGAGLLYLSGEEGPTSRARQAWSRAQKQQVPQGRMPVLGSLHEHPPDGVFSCYLDPDTGTVHLFGLDLEYQPFTPLADNQPVLRRSLALDARCRGGTLALKTVALGTRGTPVLRLFRGPQGTPLGEFSLARSEHGFALSADGSLLARQVGDWRLVVTPAGGEAPKAVTRAGGFSPNLQFRLGEGWLALQTGKHLHLIRWDGGPLTVWHQPAFGPLKEDPVPSPMGRSTFLKTGIPGQPVGVPERLHYDLNRFQAGARAGGLIAVADRFGQVVVLDANEKVVCLFFAFRNRLAGWLPDGTCLGPANFTGRPETAGATDRFSRALRQAAAGRSHP
jgi:hypothetical protein